MLKRKEKFVTVPARLVAAFDASGKENSPCVVVAGFLSSHDKWRSFDSQWVKRLRQDGLEYFHMVDFASCTKQFAQGWSDNEERRRKLFGDLIDIIKSHVYRQFASVVPMGEFEKLTAENRKQYSLNAYVLAARSCAADVRRWQEKESFHWPTGYAFEDGDEGRGLLDTCFVEDNLPRPVFKPKKDTPQKDGTVVRGYTPLQAADIFAWELNKLIRDMLAGEPRVPRFRWGLEQLLKIPGEPGYYDPDRLQNLDERLKRLAASKAEDNLAQ